LLGLACDGCSGKASGCSDGEQSRKHHCSHVSNLFCGIASMPEYAASLAAARLNQS
tara:strand:- start:1601 stop:1768 length:168 start_codon:yes stop_codon:yes gene_type:complete